MPAHIKLVNMTEVIEAIGGPKISQEEQMAWLEANTTLTEYYSIGSGKGGRVMVRPEDAELLKKGQWTAQRRRRSKLQIEGLGPAEIRTIEVEKIVERIDPQWKSEIETMVLDETARVDQLHKAVEEVTKVYREFRASVDPMVARNLPEPPPLPSKYRWKVVVIGGDNRVYNRLTQVFPMIRFVHIEAGGAAGESHKRSRGAWPEGDLIILMASFTGHALQSSAEAFYGKGRVNIVRGSIGSVEAAISMWRNQQDKEAS